MFWTDTKRIIRSGYHNFTRSKFTSLASVLVMIVTLFVITSLIFVQAALQSALTNLKNQADVTVYFVPGASEANIHTVQTELQKFPEVASVTETTADQALENFKEKHANDYLTLQAIDEINNNPLGATLNIKAKDPSQYEAISNYFQQDTTLAQSVTTVIDNIDYHQNQPIIDKLNSIINGAQRLGFALALILIIISILITFNTLRIIIYMSREEINVMRLVGAGSRYIRGPFVVSGILVGIVASIVTMLLFCPVSTWLGSQMTDFLGINFFSYYIANFFQLFIITLFVGVALGSVSSFFAIHKYIRK